MPAQAGHSPHTWLALACVAVCVLAAREKRTVAGCAGLLCFVLLCALLYLLTCEFLRLNLGKFGIGRYMWVNLGLGGISVIWTIMCVCVEYM